VRIAEIKARYHVGSDTPRRLTPPDDLQPRLFAS
jgi:hypothetical protein